MFNIDFLKRIFRFSEKKYITLIIMLCCFLPVFSMENINDEISVESKFSKAIEDNSFLIEEAYNQEKGIIQHIFTGMNNLSPLHDRDFSFTQEWPLWGQTSQLSYTVLYNSYNSDELYGFGDLLINYRYQLFDKNDFAAFSPRISLILPVGNKEKALGKGTTGLQVNLPVSKRLSENLTLHFNAGLTYFNDFTSVNSENKQITSSITCYNTGVSLIWLASYNLNFIFEAVTGSSDEVYNGKISYCNESVINPGLRYAFDTGDLQIVPGLAFPISFSEGEVNTGVYLYLSFEHPF